MIRTSLLAALLIASALPAWADDSGIVVDHAWARATPGAGSTGAVYLTVTDHGTPDQLIGISTPAAGMAMMHESSEENGVSKMRMLASVKLPANQPVTFHPGGMHIMLEELKAPLKTGTSFPLTLTFAKAPPQTVTVTVLKPGAAGPDEMNGMAGMKMSQ